MMLCTFGKGKERISLGRRSESGVLVVVRGRDQVREYRFSDSSSLRTFQSDMEAFLRKTGWTLLEYSPERRRRDQDRRRFPRLGERRRWLADTKERTVAPSYSSGTCSARQSAASRSNHAIGPSEA
jgi:hypothetical protein